MTERSDIVVQKVDKGFLFSVADETLSDRGRWNGLCYFLTIAHEAFANEIKHADFRIHENYLDGFLNELINTGISNEQLFDDFDLLNESKDKGEYQRLVVLDLLLKTTKRFCNKYVEFRVNELRAFQETMPFNKFLKFLVGEKELYDNEYGSDKSSEYLKIVAEAHRRPNHILYNEIVEYMGLCKEFPYLVGDEGGALSDTKKVQWHGTYEQLVAFWGFCSEVDFIKQKDIGVDWELLQEHFEVVKKDGALVDMSKASTKFSTIKENLAAPSSPSKYKKTKAMKSLVVDLLKGVISKLEC